MNLSIPLAILFDLDGTLADTAPDLAEAINHLRKSRGLAPTAYEILRPVASAGARGLIGAAFGVMPSDAEYEPLRKEFMVTYESAIAVNTRLFEGIPQLLANLQKCGIVWGIVTNKAACLTDQLVPQIGLGHAACVISGDTTPYPKPHPAPLLEAARRLAIDPKNCWYVGDDLRDIQAGAAAGMTTVAAAWGYCGDVWPAKWGADVIIGSPHEFSELIESLFKTR